MLKMGTYCVSIPVHEPKEDKPDPDTKRFESNIIHHAPALLNSPREWATYRLNSWEDNWTLDSSEWDTESLSQWAVQGLMVD